jgi:hypothetical protein
MFKAAILCRTAAPECLALQMNLRPARHNPSSGIMDEIGGALRVRGGGENSVAVAGQHFKPIRQIGGVVFAGLKRKFEVGAEESRSELGIGSGGSRLVEDTSHRAGRLVAC